MGIEPDQPRLSPRFNGFEVRAIHQNRCASAINFSPGLKTGDSSIAEAHL